jgi:hypothetical protein
MTIQTNGSNISAWAIAGVAAQSGMTTGGWWQSYTAEKQQAADPSLSGLSGSAQVATYATGLDENDFGTVTYGFANGGGGETTVQITGEIASAYDLWADSFGLVGDQRLPEASPAGDDVSNLVKYGLGLDPNAPAATPDLLQTIEIEGQDYLSIRFTRTGNRTDLTTSGEATTSLLDWDAGALGVSVTAESNGDGTETVTIRSLTPMTEQPRMFLRAVFNL